VSVALWVFSIGIKEKTNYHDLCKDVTVGISNEDYALFEKIALEKKVRIELVVKRAVASYAKMLREDED
jgi:hypothetical protein